MKARDEIKLEELVDGFDRGISALDELRADQLNDSMRLQGAQNGTQTREYERLKMKYGEGHARALSAAAKASIGRERLKALALVYVSASQPRADAGDGWAVDGFVRDSSGAPVEGVTVAAYDRQERWHKELNYGCTDERGYFSLVVEKLPENPPQPVFMRVSKGKKLLISNESRLNPAANISERIEIILNDAGGKGGRSDCASPSGEKADVKTGQPMPPYNDVPEKPKTPAPPPPPPPPKQQQQQPKASPKAGDTAAVRSEIAVNQAGNVKKAEEKAAASEEIKDTKSDKVSAATLGEAHGSKAPKAPMKKVKKSGAKPVAQAAKNRSSKRRKS